MEDKKLISLLKFYKKNNVEVELIIKTKGGMIIRGKIIKLNRLLKRYIIIKSKDNDFIKVFVEDIIYNTLIPSNFVQETEKNKKINKRRSPISPKLRFEVFKRDKFSCRYCGACGKDVELEVDHIIPISRGGKDELSNLKTACWDCNRGKGDSV